MSDFVRDDIRLGEITRRAEPLVELAEERQVEVHLAIRGAVERSHFRPTDAAGRLGGAVEQHEHGRYVCLTTLPEDLAPGVLSIAEHDRDEFRLRVVIANAGRP